MSCHWGQYRSGFLDRDQGRALGGISRLLAAATAIDKGEKWGNLESILTLYRGYVLGMHGLQSS